MSEPTLFFLCGKAASGKSTLAAKLAEEPSRVVLTEDDLLHALYGDVLVSLKDYVRCSGKLKAAIKPLVLQLVSKGMSVILDFPANTPEQRAWLKALAQEAGCDCELHFLDVSDQECKARIAERNRQGSHPFTLTEEQFDQLSRHFVPPSEGEGFLITSYQSS